MNSVPCPPEGDGLVWSGGNCGPQALSCLLPVSANPVLLLRPHRLLMCGLRACLCSLRLSWGVTERVWPTEPAILAIWTFTPKVGRTLNLEGN